MNDLKPNGGERINDFTLTMDIKIDGIPEDGCVGVGVAWYRFRVVCDCFESMLRWTSAALKQAYWGWRSGSVAHLAYRVYCLKAEVLPVSS